MARLLCGRVQGERLSEAFGVGLVLGALVRLFTVEASGGDLPSSSE